MVVIDTCPHPDCGITSEPYRRAPKGKAVECPTCGRSFVADARPATDERSITRGQVIGLLVMPCNLLTAVGLILRVFSLVIFVMGMWPLVFAAAPPPPGVVPDALFEMALGLLICGWGAAICSGASQMLALVSYKWAMAGSILAIPVLVGIYGLVMLQDPNVIDAFDEDSA